MSTGDALLAIVIGCASLLALFCLSLPFVSRLYLRSMWLNNMPPEMTYFPDRHFQ